MAAENGNNKSSNSSSTSGYHEPIWLRGIRDTPSRVLRNALTHNQEVDNVEINVTDHYSEQADEAQDFLANRVCRLQGLKSLRFLPDRFDQVYEFPTPLVTTCLTQVPDLQMLSLCSVDLSGSTEDWTQFCQALQDHSSLRLLRLIRSRLPEQDTSLLLDQLASALSNITTLKEVELSAAEEDSLGTLSVHSLQQIYTAQNLEKLRLDNFILSQEHLLPLCQQLANNHQNQSLRLKGLFLSSCHLTAEGLQALGHMIETNTSLEELALWLACSSSDRNNKNHLKYPDECFLEIVQGLAQNSTLKHFRLSGSSSIGSPRMSEATQQAFLEMLRHQNYTLHTLSLLDIHRANTNTGTATTTATSTNINVAAEMDFFLALNRIGRRLVVAQDNSSIDTCVRVLQKAQVDLNCLFYFLSMKPQLLHHAA